VEPKTVPRVNFWRTAAFVEKYCGTSAAKAQVSASPAAEGYPSQIKLKQKVEKALSAGQLLIKEA